MKTTLILSLISILLGANAMADYKLSANQKVIVCNGEDSQTLRLNAQRTAIKFTVEGEGIGAQKIIDVKTDNKTFVSYSTSELTLILTNKGDSFLYDGDQDSQELDCK